MIGGMLADSGLLPKLQQSAVDTNRRPLGIYGDPAYLLRVFNKSMSSVRIAVEWLFGDITN